MWRSQDERCMQMVQVVVVVQIMESYWVCGEEVEYVGRLAIEVRGCFEGVYED